ncbi:DUF2798 domain-containing protein [Roseibium sp. RKSG952]|uniref:DUF2798 domain-containing protein n=1 Tax=Roseibium sp. RKSG952 TaxID=2529384 RepID=UPI0012BB636F|nr:DUF2798 domain-containing protein [Roseibium sp. RKSG952]MTH97952.1 DUF2798 domain-containing protein [Roseibium sp. RKSG952]
MKQTLVLAITSTALMSLGMSFVMSLWISWIHTGFTPGFTARWLDTFVLAWPAAALTSCLLMPVVKRLSMGIAESLARAPQARTDGL